MAGLKREQVESLCEFVDAKIREQGCDHSLRFTREWAVGESVNWDDLLDILEAYGGHCDCEVVLNLPEDEDLESKDMPPVVVAENAWRLPPSFTCNANDTFTKIIVCRAQVAQNTYSADGETLVPAPRGAKARKRVRKSVLFFVGCTSGLPSEVGVVGECAPISAESFARQVAGSGIAELRDFTYREAAFVLSKVAGLAPGTSVGTHFMEVCGISGVWEELRVHKIVLRR